MVELNGSYRDVCAIVFDFDGVIVESANIKTEAFLALFESHPEHLDAIREYHLKHQGISRYTKFEWIYRELLRRPLSTQESARLGAAFSKIVFQRVLRCPYVPGAEALLRFLHNRVPLFVASGTPHAELVDIIARRRLATFFAAVWGTPTDKSVAVRLVMERIGARPQQILFVGDARSDHRAATDTDVRFVARHTADTIDDWRRMGVVSVADLRDLHVLLDGKLPVAARVSQPRG